jgi:hypothetical protein
MYKLTNHGPISRLSDNASIPPDPANRDYAEYLEWVAAGNTPLPVDLPTSEQIIVGFSAEIQKRLDDFAKTRGYDGVLSACTYATSGNMHFSAEGQYCVTARDATWAKCYEILDAVQGGTRPMPTLEDILLELPVLAWPA